jgi:hypothetical protein
MSASVLKIHKPIKWRLPGDKCLMPDDDFDNAFRLDYLSASQTQMRSQYKKLQKLNS